MQTDTRRYISIHALREEGDCETKERMIKKQIFLSTPSARRATDGTDKVIDKATISIHALREEGDPVQNPAQWILYKHFYPRPPRGGRLNMGALKMGLHEISIHALREEGDPDDDGSRKRDK